VKILVCTDGSEQSQKALEEAAKIAEGRHIIDVAIIHVYDHRADLSSFASHGGFAAEDVKSFRKMVEEHKEERKKILSEALKVFEGMDVRVRTIFKVGHPAQIIINEACEGGYDMIVIGSRGLSGLQRLFLGSVSSAVVQQAKNCNVLTVKK